MQTTIEKSALPASDQIADALIDDVRTGVIAEGAPFPSERELCDRFVTSRPTIRVALLAMQARGYANLETTKRPRACKPTIGTVFQTAGKGLSDVLGRVETNAYLDQVRQFIEVGAVRLAAQDASNIQVAKINAALENCFRTLDNDADFARADADFHRAIVAVVRNPILLELHDRFVFDIVASRPVDTNRRERNKTSYEEHCQIYEAIAQSDPAQAMAVMDGHLARSYRANLPAPARLQSSTESN